MRRMMRRALAVVNYRKHRKCSLPVVGRPLPQWQLQWARTNPGWSTYPSLPGPFLALALKVPCPRNLLDAGQTWMLFTLDEMQQVWHCGEMSRAWGPHRWRITESRGQNAQTKSGAALLEGMRCVPVAVAGEETGGSQW